MKYRVVVPKSKPFKGSDGSTEHFVEAPSKESALSQVLVRLLKSSGSKLKYTDKTNGQTQDFDKNRVGLLYHLIRGAGDYDITISDTPDKKDKDDWKAKGVHDMKNKTKEKDETQMSLLAKEKTSKHISMLDDLAGVLEHKGLKRYAEKMDEVTNTLENVMPTIVVITESESQESILVDKLNFSLSLEYSAWLQYVNHASMIEGPGFESFIDHLKQHASMEADHAQKVADRVSYLGGTPTLEIYHRETSTDPVTMLRMDLEAEELAISTYQEIIALARSINDYGTAHLAEEILVDEEEHKLDLITILGKNITQ